MDEDNKLPLVKSALSLLTADLRSTDRVSIVVYAGASGCVLDGCNGSDSRKIDAALSHLSAGGSTAGGAGIELAYAVAEKNYINGGNNRVILCTDGDFNVGPSSTDELERLIEKKRVTGVYLSVMGFGTGNTKDNKMETLADKGNGNYAYIDTLMEAQKVLVNEAASTLFTVAKDVKLQIEFNPKAVSEYRLIGYDNRILNAEDFNNDRKDAGEVGAGHCVTAFYELVLVGSGTGGVDQPVFADNNEAVKPADDWMYVKLRYKQPDSDTSQLITKMAGKANYTATPDNDFLFASAVAEFSLLLKNSEYAGSANFDSLISRATTARGADPDGYRSQFLQLASLARQLSQQ
jgi:Ca-activated chloride channel family protein